MIVKALLPIVLLAPATLANSAWSQCGGQNWSGDKTCPSGYACVVQNSSYSQCVPSSSGSNPSTSSRPPTTTTVATQAPAGTPGVTTRYWDCCKPSCAWFGKGPQSSKSCAKDGVTPLANTVTSGCNGGTAYMCNNQQPIVVNDNLAYGFAAANIPGSSEQQWCCACYELTFTNTAIAGKKMIVQVTNTGADLGSHHFDLQLPGGGVGLFNGCAPQWGAPGQGWGQQYGGVSSDSECGQLPSSLQPGCRFRFGWFKNADNPSMNFRKVQCPSQLTAATGCSQ